MGTRWNAPHALSHTQQTFAHLHTYRVRIKRVIPYTHAHAVYINTHIQNVQSQQNYLTIRRCLLIYIIVYYYTLLSLRNKANEWYIPDYIIIFTRFNQNTLPYRNVIKELCQRLYLLLWMALASREITISPLLVSMNGASLNNAQKALNNLCWLEQKCANTSWV